MGTCLDVASCAAKAPTGGKYAVVYVHLGNPRWPWLPFIVSLSAAMKKLAADTGGEADIVVMMLASDAKKLGSEHRSLIQTYRIRLLEVDWALPPTLKWYPSNWWPGKADGWCGPM